MSQDEDRRQYMRDYMRAYRDRRRVAAVESLGGMCVRCGSTVDLEFDHVDGSTKEFLVSTWSVSKEREAAELAKCQLLCERCHKKKSAECGEVGGGWNRVDDPDHGTNLMYNREKCRCEDCRRWKRLSRQGLVDANGNERSSVRGV